MDIEIDAVVVGPLQVNCWIVRPRGGRDAVVIDPGDEPDTILSRVAESGVTVRRILLTHGHVDHIAGVGALHRATGAPVWVHPADRALYASPANALPPLVEHPDDLPEPVELDSTGLPDLPVHVIETPGHTPGSCTFVVDAGPPVLFSGDLLFRDSVGRTDLPGGDPGTLIRSLQAVLEYPDDALVCPGHGPQTTIGRERRMNPFVREWLES